MKLSLSMAMVVIATTLNSVSAANLRKLDADDFFDDRTALDKVWTDDEVTNEGIDTAEGESWMPANDSPGDGDDPDDYVHQWPLPEVYPLDNTTTVEDQGRHLAVGSCRVFADGSYFHPTAGTCFNLGGSWWNDKVTYIQASSDTCIDVYEHHEGGRHQEYCGSDWLKLGQLSREVSRVCCETISGDGNGGNGNGGNGNGGNDNVWLASHNSRRQKYHAKYDVSYVPLKWSNALAASAQKYAEDMARNNNFAHSNGNYGENLAWNSGKSSPSADNVLQRWTENEESKRGGHFTQVLWRATKYVGCGQASSGSGSYQACQYVTPGNCNGPSNMLVSSSPCSPKCPQEGCF
jgi:hypothetical protein